MVMIYMTGYWRYSILRSHQQETSVQTQVCLLRKTELIEEKMSYIPMKGAPASRKKLS